MNEFRYLLDTNVLIDVLGDARSGATMRLGECRRGTVAVSAISYAETLLGLSRRGPDAVERARALFDLVEVLAFDRDAAAAYAELPFRRGSYDRLIAAHARALNLVLVTNNVRDFADVPGLRIENWAEA